MLWVTDQKVRLQTPALPSCTLVLMSMNFNSLLQECCIIADPVLLGFLTSQDRWRIYINGTVMTL